MPDIESLYPPAPAGVPADLTAPSRAYRSRVVLVLLCLIVFVGTYLGLTIGSAVACYYCVAELAADDPPAPPPQTKYVVQNGRTYAYATPPHSRREKPVFGLLVGAAASGLLCLFLVKGLFKRTRASDGIRVEVTEAEQPKLFAFIRKLCQEVGAPFPHKVFVVPEVNAAVSFDESFLNLVLPSRKNLLIGLALVNRLNLTEFKAVLAHEFGHFSQNSMRLGSYVYTANRVVAEVVYGRDDFLAALRQAHEALRIQLGRADGLLLPPLTNMTAGAPLRPFLLADPLLDNLPGYTSSLNGAWVQRLMGQTGEAIEKAARVLFKSTGGLLALQERTAERWAAARTTAPAPQPEPAPDVPA